MKPFLSFLVLTFILGCSGKKVLQQTPTWRLVYQNDFNGKTISGSKQNLSKALKQGSPIRVAWGEKLADGTSVVEFAVPDFTSLMNDSDVVVQFPMSLIQTNYLDPKKSFLKTNPPTGWRALMSTDGHYHQFHYDIKTGEITRIMYARTNMSWFAWTAANDNRPVPDLATENTFKLDSVIRK